MGEPQPERCFNGCGIELGRVRDFDGAGTALQGVVADYPKGDELNGGAECPVATGRQ